MSRLFPALPLYSSIVTSGLGMLATGIIVMAVPWAFLSGGGSPLGAGIVAALLHLPLAFGFAVGGHLVDSLGPRKVLLSTDFASAFGAVGAAAVVILGGDWWLVLALLILSNLAGTPGAVAQDARIPELAQLARIPLERSNAMRDIAGNLGQVGGPAGGVVLVETIGLGHTLALAAAILVAIWVIDWLTFPHFPTVPHDQPAPHPLCGLPSIMSDSGLRAIAGLGVLMVAVFHSLDEVLAPNLALSSGQDGFGLAGFLALSALSALAGAVLYAIWGVRFAPRRVFLAGIACSAVGFVLLALLPSIWGFRIAPLWIGLGIGPLWPIVLTAIQLRVGLERRGAVIGALSAVVLLAQPASALLAAPCVVWLGPQGLTTGLAVVLGCVALAAPWLPGLRSMLSETPAHRQGSEPFSDSPMVSSQEKTK